MKLFEYSAEQGSWDQVAYDIVGKSKTSASGTSIALVNGGDTLAIGGGPNGTSKGSVIIYAQDETSSKPSSMPSSMPSEMPSGQPSSIPSSWPSSMPSEMPSGQPSSAPSSRPSSMPSDMPSGQPSSAPSSRPSLMPSEKPSSYPSSAPSSRPSSMQSEKPSSRPSSAPSSQPSLLPSEHPSSIPSVTPTISLEPSSQPSAFVEREFMILSQFKKLTDLPMGARDDKNWCLERLLAAGISGGNTLKMRPCETGNIRQTWFYDRQQSVIKSRNGIFCIARDGKQLVAISCTATATNAPKTHISSDALNLTRKPTKGSISMLTDNKNTFYYAIDTIRMFSRVKLLKNGTQNSSYDKWQLRYKGPSEFPSSVSGYSFARQLLYMA